MQYPDIITITWKDNPTPIYELDGNGKPTDIETGDYLPGESHTFISKCRIEANQSSRKVEGVDGVMIDYSYNVFMPKAGIIIPAFEAEYATSGPSVGVIHGNVKRMRNGLYNSQLWL